MQRNLMPLRTWRVGCLLDNYLIFLSSTGGAWGSGGPDPASSLRQDARPPETACRQYTIRPTYRQGEETQSKFDWSRS